jgi:quinoprotein glucose dehydrogenase
MWEPRDPGKNQPAYILSPLANLPDGPGGFVHYPGTGLPDKYKGCFFLACYKGSSLTSQVAVLKPVPDGASFKLETLETFIPGCQATDVDFGPDSRLYVSFWDEGWERTAQGRIMKVEHEEARKAQGAQIAEVQKLLGEGMKSRSAEELAKLLGHKDQRVRLEAQWELEMRPDALGLLAGVQAQNTFPGVLHASWAQSNITRRTSRGKLYIFTGNWVRPWFASASPEVQAALLLAEAQITAPFVPEDRPALTVLLKTGPPAVQAAAARVFANRGSSLSSGILVNWALDVSNDQYLQHACVQSIVTAIMRYNDKNVAAILAPLFSSFRPEARICAG